MTVGQGAEECANVQRTEAAQDEQDDGERFVVAARYANRAGQHASYLAAGACGRRLGRQHETLGPDLLYSRDKGPAEPVLVRNGGLGAAWHCDGASRA
jgi:hypothetical protein